METRDPGRRVNRRRELLLPSKSHRPARRSPAPGNFPPCSRAGNTPLKMRDEGDRMRRKNEMVRKGQKAVKGLSYVCWCLTCGRHDYRKIDDRDYDLQGYCGARTWGRLGGIYLDQSRVFLIFEEITIICVFLVILLMYIFYVKYPYNKNSDEDIEELNDETENMMKATRQGRIGKDPEITVWRSVEGVWQGRQHSPL